MNDNPNQPTGPSLPWGMPRPGAPPQQPGQMGSYGPPEPYGRPGQQPMGQPSYPMPPRPPGAMTGQALPGQHPGFPGNNTPPPHMYGPPPGHPQYPMHPQYNPNAPRPPPPAQPPHGGPGYPRPPMDGHGYGPQRPPGPPMGMPPRPSMPPGPPGNWPDQPYTGQRGPPPQYPPMGGGPQFNRLPGDGPRPGQGPRGPYNTGYDVPPLGPAPPEPRIPDNLPGTASLVFDVDKKMLVVLRDGRKLVGYLRTLDQFANIVLHETIERIHVGKEYGDIPRGILVIRGENIVLIGEIDPEKDRESPLVEVDINDILDKQREEQEKREEAIKIKNRILLERGYSLPSDPLFDDLYG